jgi:hypothetical protein
MNYSLALLLVLLIDLGVVLAGMTIGWLWEKSPLADHLADYLDRHDDADGRTDQGSL